MKTSIYKIIIINDYWCNKNKIIMVIIIIIMPNTYIYIIIIMLFNILLIFGDRKIKIKKNQKNETNKKNEIKLYNTKILRAFFYLAND